MLSEAFSEYRPLYTAAGFEATTPPAEKVLARLAEGPLWVAVGREGILGTASAVPEGEGLYVRGMAVLPSARGLRIGERLLIEIENYALRHAHSRLFLSTTPFLERAIRLYERFGFRRTTEGPHGLFGTPLFTMEKQLDTPLSIRGSREEAS